MLYRNLLLSMMGAFSNLFKISLQSKWRRWVPIIRAAQGSVRAPLRPAEEQSRPGGPAGYDV